MFSSPKTTCYLYERPGPHRADSFGARLARKVRPRGVAPLFFVNDIIPNELARWVGKRSHSKRFSADRSARALFAAIH